MPTLNDIQIRLIVDGREMTATLDDLKKQLGGVDQKSSQASKGIVSGFKDARLAILGVVAVVSGLVIGINKAVTAASDQEEQINKMNVTFRGVQKEATAMRDTLVDAYFMSRTEATKLLSASGDMLTGFGFGQKAALDMSGDVQKLAADLASFNNVQGGATVVSEALTKALLGERESLKTYGIAIDEAMIKEELHAQGLDNLTGFALKQAKAQATLTLAYRQSPNAVGDLARTSDSYANTVRRVEAQVEDLLVELGKGFMPIASEVLNWFMGAIKVAKTLIGLWRDLADAIGLGTQSLTEYREELKKLTQAELERELIQINKQLADAQEKVNKGNEEAGSVWEGVKVAMFGVTKNTAWLSNQMIAQGPVIEQLEAKKKTLISVMKGETEAILDNINALDEEKDKLVEIDDYTKISFENEQELEEQKLEAEIERANEKFEHEQWLSTERAKIAAKKKAADDKAKADQDKKDQEDAKKKQSLASAQESALYAIERAWAGKSKGLAIALSLINTFQAITNALKVGIPPWNMAQAAAIGAMGFAQVSSIKSQSFATGGMVDRPTLGLVGEAGPEIIAPKKDFIGVVQSLIKEGSIQGDGSKKAIKELTEKFAALELKTELDAESLSIIVQTGDKARVRREF